jgi:hypothetical protein
MKRVSQALIMVALFSVMNLAGLSEAAFYKYVDKNGGVHFTDQIDSIPPEYRHQIKEYRDRQPAETPSPKENEASKEPGAAERERQLKEAEQKKEAEAKAQQEKAAREEKEKVLKEKEISGLQEQITAKQQEQRSLRTNWMVYDKIRLNQLNEEIAGIEKQIEEIKKETPE